MMSGEDRLVSMRRWVAVLRELKGPIPKAAKSSSAPKDKAVRKTVVKTKLRGDCGLSPHVGKREEGGSERRIGGISVNCGKLS